MVSLPFLDLGGNVSPTISINSMDLTDLHLPKLVSATVDTHVHLPDMFELVFDDTENAIVGELMVRIGALVEVYGGESGNPEAQCLIKGEVTSIEGNYIGTEIHTVVRGFEKSHRMQRATRTRTFVDMSDSDIASQLATEAGFMETEIEDSPITHKHIAQINETDWAFLRGRAAELCYETGVAQGTFYFRPASSTKPSGGGGLMGAAAGAVAGALGMGPPTLTFQDNLMWFRPRMSAGNLPEQVEVRVYDYEAAEVVVGQADLKTGTAKIESEDPDPVELASSFTGFPFPIPSLPNIPGLPSLGAAPSDKARVLVNRPVAWGSALSSAVDEMAKGLAEHIASTVLEAEGMAYGNPGIQAGQKVVIKGVAEEFGGEWMVTNATHSFVPDQGGYTTRFEVSGRHDRSLLSLTSLGASSSPVSRMEGHVIGLVTNNNDPDTMGRVKVGFPWLAPNYESDWARVVQVGMGKEWGMLWLPEVGDEVLVGFEFGDARRPYIIGGLINGKTEHPMLSSAVKSSGMSAQIVQRGMTSRTGNQLLFEDEIPSPLAPTPPTKGVITLGDGDGKMQVTIDVVNGELTIHCEGGVMNPIGKIVIENTSTTGTIELKSAGDVTVQADNPGKLTLKGAMGVSIDGGTGQVEIKGTAGVKADAGAGMLELKGSMVKLN
jgi:phage protein D